MKAATNLPVYVMADENVPGHVGSGDVTMVYPAGSTHCLLWTGLESAGGGVSSNISVSCRSGTHIIDIDSAHEVSLVLDTANSSSTQRCECHGKRHRNSPVVTRVLVACGSRLRCAAQFAHRSAFERRQE